MTTAIMQPYIFPYIGYFQLVQAADHFVFYDDVNFINGGWINRNKILINGQNSMFSIPLINPSQNKLINEIGIFRGNRDIKKVMKSIKFEYSKAPFFGDVYPWIEKIFNAEYSSIAFMAGESVVKTSEYLGLNTEFYYSSQFAPETIDLSRSERLIYITKKLNSSHYINAIGGMELYTKDEFEEAGIKLDFLKPVISQNDQLSIIDEMMHNSIGAIQKLLHSFQWQ